MLYEAFLNGFAILSTIVATLRAGSRIAYISEHGAIGLVDGPRIAPPPATTSATALVRGDNETATASNATAGERQAASIGDDYSIGAANRNTKDTYNPALYEIAENFKRCVRIAASGAATEDSHRCENFRYCPITTFEPLPAERYDPQPRPEESSSARSFRNGGLRRFWNEVRSFAEDQILKPARKDPFGEKAYTLGYAHYAPKSFPENETETSDSNKPTGKLRSLSDFEVATEADYYYHTVSASPESTTKRRRLAQLKAYCPEAFGDLRSSTFGISEEDYLESVLGTMVSFQSNSKGAARSGGIFFFTSDGAYMIKTIPDREKKSLLKILPDYYDHMKRCGRSSLLTRFCGMYGITIEEEDEATTIDKSVGDGDPSRDILDVSSDSDDKSSSSFAPTGKEYTFVVMNAVFPAEANTFVSERFDLKGSTVGREVSRKELESEGNRAVLKDLDLSREVELVRSKQQQEEEEEERLLQNTNRGRGHWWGRTRRRGPIGSKRRKNEEPAGFTIGATSKAALFSQLRKDVQFLTKCHVMDYSLLVGVVHTDGAVGGYSAGREGSSAAGATESSILTPEIVETIEKQKKVLERLEAPPSAAADRKNRRLPKLDSALLHTLTTPARLMLSPPLYVARKTWNALRLTLDSIVTAPMPYYGSGKCGVYGGKLSVMHGKRRGKRAVYYLGLIDFLQPWTTRKVVERKLKGLVGYDTDAISAVTPEEYGTRFLEFMDKHIN